MDWLAFPVGAKPLSGFSPRTASHVMQGREEKQKYLASLFSLPFNLIIKRLALPLAKLSLAGNQLALEPGKGSVQGQTSGIQSERKDEGI